MEKDKKLTMIIYVLFIVIVSLLIFCAVKLTSEGSKCMQAPMNYGIRQIEKGAIQGVVKCECTSLDSNEILILTHNTSRIQKLADFIGSYP